MQTHQQATRESKEKPNGSARVVSSQRAILDFLKRIKVEEQVFAGRGLVQMQQHQTQDGSIKADYKFIDTMVELTYNPEERDSVNVSFYTPRGVSWGERLGKFAHLMHI